MKMRASVPPYTGTITSIHQRPRGRRVLSDTDDERDAVVDDDQRIVAEGERHPAVSEQQTVWQRLSLKQLRWTVLALILVVTASFGGLNTTHHVTPISFGQSYSAGALTVTPHAVSLVDHFVGMPRMAPQCRLLVLKVTIQNTAHETVPFATPDVVAGAPSDCDKHTTADTESFGLTGIANKLGATFRGHEVIPVPSIDAGFTYDYSVVWVVSRAESAHHPEVTIRFYKMASFISTFVLSHRWGGDADRYGELRIPNLGSA